MAQLKCSGCACVKFEAWGLLQAVQVIHQFDMERKCRSGRTPRNYLFCVPSEKPGGVTLHMTVYAPAYTRSVEKGSFFDMGRPQRLLQRVYFSLLIAPELSSSLFKAENGI